MLTPLGGVDGLGLLNICQPSGKSDKSNVLKNRSVVSSHSQKLETERAEEIKMDTLKIIFNSHGGPVLTMRAVKIREKRVANTLLPDVQGCACNNNQHL